MSAHYLVEEDGRIFQLVDEKNRAWHAGKSFWRGITDINSASIGIELVNPGHQYGYRAFPAAQIKALKELMRAIIARHKMAAATCVLAHADIAPERKEGSRANCFRGKSWRKTASGFGPNRRESDYAFADDAEVQNLLRAIGYDCPASESYDQPTRAALLAFQRHYHPENLTGTPERETVARLRRSERTLWLPLRQLIPAPDRFGQRCETFTTRS